jgi:hypothetical protein
MALQHDSLHEEKRTATSWALVRFSWCLAVIISPAIDQVQYWARFGAAGFAPDDSTHFANRPNRMPACQQGRWHDP